MKFLSYPLNPSTPSPFNDIKAICYPPFVKSSQTLVLIITISNGICYKQLHCLIYRIPYCQIHVKFSMATTPYSKEQLNYFRICTIATDILPQGLRVIFKQEWDNRYRATFGEWKDTPQNGLDFYNGESPGNKKRHARLLATMIKGNRAEWDGTMLFLCHPAL